MVSSFWTSVVPLETISLLHTPLLVRLTTGSSRHFSIDVSGTPFLTNLLLAEWMLGPLSQPSKQRDLPMASVMYGCNDWTQLMTLRDNCSSEWCMVFTATLH